MKYSQEEQNQILRKINAGVIGKRKEGHWDQIAKITTVTKKDCIKSAKKYNTLKEWREAEYYHQNLAQRNNWTDEIIKITGLERENDEWTPEKLFDLAKQSEEKRWTWFLKANVSVEHAAKRLGIYDELKSMFPTGRTSKYDDYTKEQLLAIPKKYNNISDMIRSNQAYWRWIKNNGMEDQIRNMFK